jgi:hypothetical protein
LSGLRAQLLGERKHFAIGCDAQLRLAEPAIRRGDLQSTGSIACLTQNPHQPYNHPALGWRRGHALPPQADALGQVAGRNNFIGQPFQCFVVKALQPVALAFLPLFELDGIGQGQPIQKWSRVQLNGPFGSASFQSLLELDHVDAQRPDVQPQRLALREQDIIAQRFTKGVYGRVEELAGIGHLGLGPEQAEQTVAWE